ncbi:MAG TPA: 2'-5' RNA ligase family protein [Candidatus Saccharimonadales bacterium]|nr:2'-5' RNA ligase family protein [Candidatus Saccharimonadales bacterium]
MPYRYYIGLSLPKDAHTHISELQARLFDPEIVRQPLEPHITLLPPPALERIDPDILSEQIRAIVPRHMPLTLTLQRVETFKHSAIAIGVDSPALHDLQRALVELLPSGHTAAPHTTFRPHVTLNQAPRGRRVPLELIAAYSDLLADYLPYTCTIDYVTLYRWQGPRTYTAERL